MDHQNFASQQASTAAARREAQQGEDSLSPLEQEVLDEYAKLVGNLDDLGAVLADLAANPSAEILDSLRGLERKTTTVFTLLKAREWWMKLRIVGPQTARWDDVWVEIMNVRASRPTARKHTKSNRASRQFLLHLCSTEVYAKIQESNAHRYAENHFSPSNV
ncbi:unnamed protein product [Zymoseptoria tritici ST99CH_1A5]|uniref:DASH complex subunit DAD3 n=1 Tax=Zymoseptoria tritici ST99CH_1A5 TaxID=1276529 RepID=A0A1Y6LTU5_ZYMTR|nr:unnamed protein product [Zymoseptoria tritici ST99CH_1A5]